jgi:type IV secretory pathway VirB2 component (pilin)
VGAHHLKASGGTLGSRAETNQRQEWHERRARTSATSASPAGQGGVVSNPLLWFLGAVSGALASAFFWVLARRAGDRGLARTTAVAVVVFCGAALYFGRFL